MIAVDEHLEPGEGLPVSGGARAFVTGHTGFVGRVLTAYLETLGYSWGGYSTADGDIRDPLLLARAIRRARPSVVFHLAAAPRSDLQAEQLSVAVDGTANVLERVSEIVPLARVVVLSSSAVYGGRHDEKPVAETSARRPATAYGAAKLALEIAARRVARSLRSSMVIVRPFNLIGPGMPSSLAVGAFVEQIVQAERGRGERILRVGNTRAVRDFVDVRDAVRAFEVLARRGRRLASYNVCSGRGASVADCLEYLLRHSISPLRTESDPERRVVAGDVPIQVGDPSRIFAATGWEPSIALHQSLSDTLAHRRRSGS